MIRGHLKVLTLKALKQGKQTGYQIVKFVEEETGRKPSYGSIYPLLDELIKNGFVLCKAEDKKKICTLTKKGEEELKELIKKEGNIWEKTEEAIKLFASVHSKDKIQAQIQLIKMLKEQKISLKDVPEEVHEIKTLFSKLMIEGKLKKHKKEIGKILKNTIKELKKIK